MTPAKETLKTAVEFAQSVAYFDESLEVPAKSLIFASDLFHCLV